MYLRTGRVGGKVLDTLVEGVAYPLGAIWLDRRWTSYTAWAARCCVRLLTSQSSRCYSTK